MQEKDMVSDSLNNLNNSLSNYAGTIAQAENPQLRQTLVQIRNNCEASQFELFQLAKQRNYYQPAQPASQQDIQQVRSMFSW